MDCYLKLNNKKLTIKKKGYIYIINVKTENLFNKYYIGQTFQNPQIRLQQHFKAKTKIGTALRRTKVKNIIFNILKEGFYTEKELDKLEVKYINKYNSYDFGYNETRGNKKNNF